jgi:hypothetical protein
MYQTFDEVLDEQLQEPEVASGYLALAVPDGPREIMRRMAEVLRAGLDFSLIDPSVVDRINEALATAHVPLYWRKAA